MKLIKSFLTLLLFAVCTAFSFSVPARAAQNPLIVPLKTEQVKPAPVRKAVKFNFVRTDSLVMYETASLDADQASSRRAGLLANVGFTTKRVGISKFFRIKPEFYRKVE